MSVERFERQWEPRNRRRLHAETVPSDGKQDSAAGYYGVSPIHGPHWGWMISGYFFLGGIAGASYVIAAIADWIEPTDRRAVVRTGRYLSFLTLIPSGILLIADLGRPERFLHMLRVIKLRSPMSLGSWGLAVFGLFSGLLAALQVVDDIGQRSRILSGLAKMMPTRAIGLAGTVPAFFVAGYTGVLLGTTAVPVWARSSLLLGPLFVCSSMSTAAAAVRLLSQDGGESDISLHHLEETAAVAELALIAASAVVLGSLAKPLREGSRGKVFIWGTLLGGLCLPIVLNRVASKAGWRWLSSVASLLVLAGGLILRVSVVEAGKASAADPEATFRMTR